MANGDGKNIKPIRIKQPYKLAINNTILYDVQIPTENIITINWKNRIQNESYIAAYNIEKSTEKTVGYYYFILLLLKMIFINKNNLIFTFRCLKTIKKMAG